MAPGVVRSATGTCCARGAGSVWVCQSLFYVLNLRVCAELDVPVGVPAWCGHDVEWGEPISRSLASRSRPACVKRIQFLVLGHCHVVRHVRGSLRGGATRIILGLSYADSRPLEVEFYIVRCHKSIVHRHKTIFPSIFSCGRSPH